MTGRRLFILGNSFSKPIPLNPFPFLYIPQFSRFTLLVYLTLSQAASPLAIHHALMLPDWGATTFFLNGVFEPDAEQMSRLDRRGVTIEREAVVALGGARADVTLASGRTITLAGLFTQPRTRMASPLAALLGCEFEDGPSGPFIRTDGMRETSVPGVFACGDAALAAGNVAIAVGDGARTGGAAHHSLLFR